MAFSPKNFDSLIGLNGFSEQLLKNHFTLYQGYVNNTNKMIASIEAMAKEGKTGLPEFAEIKRRFGWEFNGMRLHELYFENISKNPAALGKQGILAKKIIECFGSIESFEKEFKATGTIRGIGWTVLYYDKTEKKLFNTWINEHDCGHLSECIPLLVMDVFEHAFMLDYGLKRAEYIDAFFKAIDWAIVEKRFEE